MTTPTAIAIRTRNTINSATSSRFAATLATSLRLLRQEDPAEIVQKRPEHRRHCRGRCKYPVWDLERGRHNCRRRAQTGHQAPDHNGQRSISAEPRFHSCNALGVQMQE